jgi:hypothetical protein
VPSAPILFAGAISQLSPPGRIQPVENFATEPFDTVYEAATLAVQRGGDLHVLFEAIMSLKATGTTKRRACEIAHRLNIQAISLIDQERQLALGFKWLYSRARCISDFQDSYQVAQDKAHAAAEGKKYDIAKGMYLNGKWTHPGREDGCKCVTQTFIEGFE